MPLDGTEETDKNSSEVSIDSQPQRKESDHKKHARSGSRKKSGGGGGNKRNSGSSKKNQKKKKKRVNPAAPDIMCRQCEKMFKGQAALESHIQAKHPRVECKKCHKTFINDQALKIHIRNKHSSKAVSRRASQLSDTAPEFVPGQAWGSTRSSFTQAPGFRRKKRPSQTRSGDAVRRASKTGVPFSGKAPKAKTKKALADAEEEKFTASQAASFPGSPIPGGSARGSITSKRRRRSSLPVPDPADLAGEAPPINYEIGAGWVIYWNPPTALEHSTNNQDYVKSLREIADFQGVASFWDKIRGIQKASNISHGAHNLMVFRRGLVPCWESFPAGGAWILNIHRWEDDVKQIDALWETVMFGLAGEAFCTPEVIGASLHIRTRGYRICIWNRDNRVGDVRFQIADKLRMLLSIHPRKEIKYKYFSCSLRDGSTTAQATPYQFVKVTF